MLAKKKKAAKEPRQFIGKLQLKALLANPKLSIEDIAKKLKTVPEIVRRYIQRYGL
ncbi:MAG: hypothetical protein M3Y08_12535 [Fibrobacterota bacterium]|nr:hypothetical protein [Fibrobacterota bacterium]